MRWKIKSINTNINDKTGKKTTTKTKQLMISIGDLVGVGKNACNAVQNALRIIPSFFNSAKEKTIRYKNGVKEESTALKDAGLEAVVSSLEILNTVIKGMDIYKGVTKAIEIATPIVQTIARASGAWASPGNVGDIAQIVLGKVQKILISLAVSGILKLKEIIWNYEFPIEEVKTEFTEYINKNLEDLTNKMPIPDLEKDYNDAYEDSLNNNKPSYNLNGVGDGIIKFEDWEIENIFSNEYKTEFVINNNKRLLKGSLIDKGIQYSDDNGKTWNDTNIEDGSWKCFSKIKNNEGNYLYLAGGIKYIQELQSPEAKFDDTNYFYYDPVIDKVMEYSYGEKKELSEKDLWVPKTSIESKGIYYSKDNGLTWTKATVTGFGKEWINDFCEFEEKEGSFSTVTASTNNYKGCLYTEDGMVWHQSKDRKADRWLDINTYDNVWKRITPDGYSNIFYTSYVTSNVGRKFSNQEIYQNFDMEPMIINKKENNEE